MKIFKKNLDLKPIFIAEVGQNHQGDINLAKQYVNIFSKSGAEGCV
jgi:sialic acid synthase SpsE